MEDSDTIDCINSDGSIDGDGHDELYGPRAFLKGTNIKAGTDAN